MFWLACVVFLLLAFAVIALAIGGAEPPAHIQTFHRSSPREQDFQRRASRLQVIGFATAGLALLIGLLGAVGLLS